MSGRTVIYPGTFDPPTYGHLDIIARAARLGDELIVAVASNVEKEPMLSLRERVDLVTGEVAVLEKSGTVTTKTRVMSFDSLLTDFAREQGAQLIVRGLRAVSDFEIEFQMASTNKRLHADLETVFLMASEHQHFVASRFVKEVNRLGGDVSSFVPDGVMRKLHSMKKGK